MGLCVFMGFLTSIRRRRRLMRYDFGQTQWCGSARYVGAVRWTFLWLSLAPGEECACVYIACSACALYASSTESNLSPNLAPSLLLFSLSLAAALRLPMRHLRPWGYEGEMCWSCTQTGATRCRLGENIKKGCIHMNSIAGCSFKNDAASRMKKHRLKNPTPRLLLN